MENRGLIFIPDISGFTRFINETDIEHSRLIIQELLELLINENKINLQISEVEGDAILFYKFGDPPKLDELYKQVETMFCAFHRAILAYDMRRYCQCPACTSAINLTLKVVTHYGEFTSYNVKQFSKLLGKDIIVAHQLLKNDIEQHEYWLVTNNLVPEQNIHGPENWMNWNHSVKQTENGEISFHYALLSTLREKIEPEPLEKMDLSDKRKLIRVSREYDTDIITLFHASGDFNYRHFWQEGVKRVEEVGHFLPRVGMRCRCILENGSQMTYSSSYSYQSDRIEFVETDEKGHEFTAYTLEKLEPHRSRLTIEVYTEKSVFGQILYLIGEKGKRQSQIEHSLDNLTGFLKELRIPGIEEPVLG